MSTSHYLQHKAWRLRNPEKRQRGKMRNYAQTRVNALYPRSEWTLWEMNVITAPNRPNDRTLSRILRRSVQAIQVKRSKMKK